MDRANGISDCEDTFSKGNLPFQPQDIRYQNIGIVTQLPEAYKVHYPLNNSLYVNIGAMILVLALGFILGIGVMMAYSRWKKRRKQDKKNLSVTASESSKTVAENESTQSSIKNERQCRSRSSSTESSPALSGEKQPVQQISLDNNVNLVQSNKSVENAEVSQTFELSEKNRLESPALGNEFEDFDGMKDKKHEYSLSKTISDNIDNTEPLSQLNIKKGLSQPCQGSDLSQAERKNKSSDTKKDMSSNRNGAEPQELKIPEIKFTRERRGSMHPSDDQQSQNNISRRPSPLGKSEENKDASNSKAGGIIKPLPVDQEFYHITGFFDKVFGDKVLIGRGGFGEVYKVTHKLEQKLYAVKKVKLFVKDDEDIRQNKLFREVFAMTSLHHPNIVRHHTTWTEEPPTGMSPKQILRKSIRNRKLTLIKKSHESLNSIADHTRMSDLGVQWDISHSEQKQNSNKQKHEEQNSSDSDESCGVSFRVKTCEKIPSTVSEEEKSDDDEMLSVLNENITRKLKDHQLIYLYMQMEYCSGDNLMSFLDRRRTQQSIQEITYIFKQILEAVQTIHEGGILHRDLKPSNIFFEKGLVKIGDFGLSWLGDQHDDDLEPTLNLVPRKSNSYTSNIGTPFYSSPEQEQSTVYDNKTDIYSLGIVLFELINCFTTKHERGQKIKALREENKIDPDICEKFPDLSKLVLAMIDKNPANRPSAKEALAILEKTIGSGENKVEKTRSLSESSQ